MKGSDRWILCSGTLAVNETVLSLSLTELNFFMSHSKPIESFTVSERLAFKAEKAKTAIKKKKVILDSGFTNFDLDSVLYTYPPVDKATAHASLNIKRIGLSKVKVALQVFSKKFILDWYARVVEKNQVEVTSKDTLKLKAPIVNYKRVPPFH